MVEDLYEEHKESDIKAEQCRILTRQCQLAVALTSLAMLIYPAAGLDYHRFHSRTKLRDHLYQLYDANLALDRWEKGFGLQSWSTSVNRGHHSVAVGAALLSIYFQ
jgi:hypothetical protein